MVMKGLMERAHKLDRKRTDGSTAYGRADMVGVTDWVDMQATRKLLDARTSKAEGVGWSGTDSKRCNKFRLNTKGKAYTAPK